ncbi:hypothetical protein [Oerskovia jenensis]|uniref:hypothetical protein n=1 Tax=Oerskovia jenensis TaxID=162169 RepID=UPI0036DEBC22
MRTFSGLRVWAVLVAFVMATLTLGMAAPAMAANDGNLAVTVLPKNPQVYSGDRLVYEAQLSCSEPAKCADVTLHFTKPAAVAAGDLGFVSTPYPPGVSSVTANPDGTVDVSYSATSAGLITQFTISWPTHNYTTAPGPQTTTMTVSTPGFEPESHDATIDLLASGTLSLAKGGPPTTRPDENYTWSIGYTFTGPDRTDPHGALAYQDVTLVDTLPAGAQFVSASNGGAYDPVARTVTWHYNSLASSSGETVTVQFPGATVGDTFTNNASITGTPLGGDPQTYTADATVTINDDAPAIAVDFGKSGTVVVPDAPQTWALQTVNRSNVSTDVTMTDPVPAGLDVTAVNRGYYAGGTRPGATVTFFYQGGTNSGPLDFNVESVPVPAGNPRVVQIVFFLPGIPVGGIASPNIVSNPDFGVIGDAGTLQNCASLTVAGQDDQTQCATVQVSPVPVPNPSLDKTVPQGPVAPGGTHTWTLSLRNNSQATPWLPKLYDLMPDAVTYVPGSLAAASTNLPSCPTAADFSEEIVADYPHGGPFTPDGPRNAVIWTYTGTAGLPYEGAPCGYTYDTTVNPGTPSGVYGGISTDADFRGNLVYGFDRDRRLPNTYGWHKDATDVDGDGDTTENVLAAGQVFAVADAASAWIEKSVTGDQDNGTWHSSAEIPGQEDQTATSTPGQDVSYRVRLGNMGNRDLNHLVAYDLLPLPANHGITNGRYNQNPPGTGNQWTPQLTGPIASPDPKLTITYSTNPDPCRPEMDNSSTHSASFYCGGAQDSSWTEAAGVTDWGAIRSVRFDFGDETFVGGQFVDVEWTMAVPTKLADGSAIQGGETTWNRVALSAHQQADGVQLLAAEAPWVVDRVEVDNSPQVHIEKWSTVDGPTDGAFDSAPGKYVVAGEPTPLTMTITNTGNEPLVDVVVTDTTQDGPAMTGLTCDFSPLGGPATGTTWDGPFGIGETFDCTGTVPAMTDEQTHTDTAKVTGVGARSGTPVDDDNPWNAHAGTTPPPAPRPTSQATPTTVPVGGGSHTGTHRGWLATTGVPAGALAALALLLVSAGAIARRRRATGEEDA